MSVMPDLKVEYALTQVASVTISRQQIATMVWENLLTRGGDPGYDFATGHPHFLWDAHGNLTIRYVQGAAVDDGEQWRRLKPMPTKEQVDAAFEERRTKIAAARGK